MTIDKVSDIIAPMWVLFTLLAVSFQLFRNAGSKRLSEDYSSLIVTFTRFAFGLPLAALAMIAFVLGHGALPQVEWPFWPWALTMGLLQIGANWCLVRLFHEKAFAVALSLTKSETIIAACFGALFLSEMPSGPAWFGIGLTAVGLAVSVFLTGRGRGASAGAHSPRAGAIFLSLLSGAGLAFSSISLKKAIAFVNAPSRGLTVAFALLIVMSLQTLALLPAILARRKGELRAMLASPRLPLLVGSLSAAGTLCWFTAFSLTLVSYVRTLGQLEFAAGILLSVFAFKERIGRKEILGIAATVAGASLVVLFP